MATNYDPEVLQKYADWLYHEAASIVFWTAARYGSYGFGVAAIPAAFYKHSQPYSNDNGSLLVVVLIFTFIPLVFGILAGQRKSFELKLEAQKVLCQRQIEMNSRAPSASA